MVKKTSIPNADNRMIRCAATWLIFSLGIAILPRAGAAFDLVAGPISTPNSIVSFASPLAGGGIQNLSIATGNITCSATNLTNSELSIGIAIVDATPNDQNGDHACPSVPPGATCSFAQSAFRIGKGVSPFHCFIGGPSGPPSNNFIGSICATTTQSNACMQAVPLPPTD